MLLQLENTNPENINKFLSFARENHLELSVIDDIKNNYFLPGTPLTPNQLTQMIENSRKTGMILLQNAHKAITGSFNAD
jgi:hypothetical protein